MYGLDLKLILTNALGFLLLLFVLRKVAWGRLLGAIDERRDLIRREVEATEQLKAEAERLRRDYDERIKTIDAEARARLQAAIHDAERIAGEIRQQADARARDLVAHAERRIAQEQAKALVELREEIVRLTLLATERVLKESLDGERQRRLIRDFIAEVEAARA
jgi:F-type H+-transporting ATPase subunit b